jgi:hypothetical protein
MAPKIIGHAARFLLVTGLPSSGTSMVAGMLRELGVGMGKGRWAGVGTRTWTRWECRDLTDGYVRRVWPGRTAEPAMDACSAYPVLMEYVNERRRLATYDSGRRVWPPQGVKHPAVMWVGECPKFNPDGFVVVDVRRFGDPEAREAEHEGGAGEWLPALQHARLKLLSKMAAEDTLSLRYEEVVANPHRAVGLLSEALSSWFGRGPWLVPERRKAALGAVEPEEVAGG